MSVRKKNDLHLRPASKYQPPSRVLRKTPPTACAIGTNAIRPRMNSVLGGHEVSPRRNRACDRDSDGPLQRDRAQAEHHARQNRGDEVRASFFLAAEADACELRRAESREEPRVDEWVRRTRQYGKP